ncbi:3-phosphoshikimate 1-carboxyvinyltransferase [Lacunisphaera limnophila]|uniref:3-phosphoshikimate 1-carboxyvinyltransferase n=1 Tax=Lacunisphaera limnophila TaxID=1838286 RepID=A0A1D8AWS1_9BACT|nr:3-phosphoshikimate 1-carboxyvinyltransferase [Lacunisphaera limnophila]AOS45336.1 3-phosphoshikimate 1-carboxyvinyltransferase [Lacunisphaera limnophila]
MSSYPPTLPIIPFTQPVRGQAPLPGSKSITNRALILAALSPRTVTLRGALFSRDTRIMVAALRALGFTVATDEAALTITIEGRGGEIPVREARIEVGNAGTAARFLTAFVCLRPDGLYHFDGDEAMRRRPIGALLEALESQGARASARAFPFTLATAGLPGGPVQLDASESSQLLSALLMVSPHARTPLDVQLKGETVSRPFVTMTERMIAQFAAQPADYAIEGDATAASYFATLAVVTEGGLDVPGLNLAPDALQGDIEFFRLLTARGLIRTAGQHVAHAPARSGVIAHFNDFSDTFLSLAAISPLLDGPTKIVGIAHTRKQETDRVAGMARELTRLGQHVIETEDALEIHPRPLTPDVEIETYHDHRFAMSFAILGCHDLRGDGRPWLTIKDPACCTKTFPAFFDLLASLRSGSH